MSMGVFNGRCVHREYNTKMLSSNNFESNFFLLFYLCMCSGNHVRSPCLHSVCSALAVLELPL